MEYRQDGWYTDSYGIRRHFCMGWCHREDGPAVIYPDGSREWWLKGWEVGMEYILDTPEKREAYFLEESLRRL